MDTGNGNFEAFKDYEDLKNRLDDVQKLYPGHGGIFSEGEEVELKGSRFCISKIISNGLKLELLPKKPI